MQAYKWLGTAVLLMSYHIAFSQLKLGDNPATITKSAILELQSTRQGLLLPRIADTTVVNTQNPPDGMVIYYTPVKQLLIRSNGAWKALVDNTMITGYVDLASAQTISGAKTFTSNDGLVSTGNFGSGNNLALSGPGTKMLWIPKKAAFRAGYASDGVWNYDSLGSYSVSMGYGNAASGYAAMAFGQGTRAYGNYSTTFGVNNTASGAYSLATGFNNTNSGDYTTSLGSNNTVNGNNSVAIGVGNTASGMNSGVFGFNSTASGNFSTAMGSYVSTNGKSGSMVMGDSTGSSLSLLRNDAVNQMMMRFAGGYKLYSDAGATNGIQIIPAGVVKYNADYSGSYDNRSLVDKAYVDNKVGTSGWSVTGNSGTTSSNFIGTTDNVSMRFRTNNTERMIIDSTGNVGLGGGATTVAKMTITGGAAIGIYCSSTGTQAVTGTSSVSNGVYGVTSASNESAVYGYTSASNANGVKGTAVSGEGVYGTSTSGSGVEGLSASGAGVSGNSTGSYGVYATTSGTGVAAVYGITSNSSHGVWGISGSGNGITGASTSGNGVYASSGSGMGVNALSSSNYALYAGSTSNHGIYATTGGAATYGVYGNATGGAGIYGAATTGSGVYGSSSSGSALYGIATTASANPLTLIGLKNGSTTDSMLTVASGIVKKVAFPNPPQSLLGGATITWNCATSTNAYVTISGASTLSITNATAGIRGILVVNVSTAGATITSWPANSYQLRPDIKEVGGGVDAPMFDGSKIGYTSNGVDMSTTTGTWVCEFYYDGSKYFWDIRRAQTMN